MKLFPNTLKNIKLVISNNNNKPVELIPMVMDLELDLNGNPIAHPQEKNNKWSCADWLIFNSNPISIPPLENLDFNLQVKVPGFSQCGQYSIIMFQTTDLNKINKEIEVVGRLGTILMFEISGRKYIDAIIKKFDILHFKEEIEFTILVRNTSNIDIQCNGSIVIIDNNKRIIDRVKINGGTGTILPESEREYKAIWKGKTLKSGSYVAKLKLYIPGSSKVHQKEIQLTI
ncbi:hypothetical protein JXQ31_17325 [candidate division KSB1 bacterium]|nr:hypothetical protein [candidate division KSB1 bacterium]